MTKICANAVIATESLQSSSSCSTFLLRQSLDNELFSFAISFGSLNGVLWNVKCFSLSNKEKMEKRRTSEKICQLDKTLNGSFEASQSVKRTATCLDFANEASDKMFG